MEQNLSQRQPTEYHSATNKAVMLSYASTGSMLPAQRASPPDTAWCLRQLVHKRFTWHLGMF